MFSWLRKWLCSPFKRKQVEPIAFDDTNPSYDYMSHAIRKLTIRVNKLESYSQQLRAHLEFSIHGATLMKTEDANKLTKQGVTAYDWETDE